MRVERIGSAFALILAIAVGCDGYTSVSGNVVDRDGKPIKSCKVALNLDDNALIDTDLTSKDGAFFVGGSHAPGKLPLSLTAEVAGYPPVSLSIERSKKHTGARVIIQQSSD